MPWLAAMALLLAIFYLMDRRNFLRAPLSLRKEEAEQGHWTIEGLGNMFPLLAILGAIFLPTPWREMVMILAGVLSWYLTPRLLHEQNAFHFAPIKEVAWLFLGIFTTMIPALDYLEYHAHALASSLGMGAFHFYYVTGIFSSLLDNAPTYLALLSVEMGLQGGSLHDASDVLRVATQNPLHLIAISLGAVFFGAMTYIGNGPNFMVKSMVTAHGIKTPDFFQYLFRYALPILLPILILVGWLFLR
jgi:Na+/H+ antiporter NhaD/arsenite permease-like protein